MAEALKSILRAKGDFVKTRIDSGQVPTPAQLAAFLSALVTELGPCIPHCPAEAVRLLKRGFAYVGWDVRTNRGVCKTPPTAEKVHEFLTKAVSKIEDFEAKIAQTVQPTPEELEDLSMACTKLWSLDYARLAPGMDYMIDLQQGKKPYCQGDFAEGPLFKFVAPDVLERPEWAAFIALLDNYEASAGKAERVTSEERHEESRFMDLIFHQPCMRYVHRYLVAKGKAPASEAAFKERLHQMWFGLYRRKVENDSSGFEHVFVGEEKDGAIVGLHNWIQLYMEEKKGNLNYMGYIKPRQRGVSYTSPSEHEQLITVQFEWCGDLKPESSSFIGTSPTFEFALYSLCFLAGEEKQIVEIGPYMVEVTCYNMHHRGKDYVGTSFPAAAPGMSPTHAATKIQAHARGREARKDPRAAQDRKNQNHAAKKIQSQFRGRRSRSDPR